MKSLRNDVRSYTSGSNLGINVVPSISLKTVIPTVMTRKTTASATDNADVNLNESATRGRDSQNNYHPITNCLSEKHQQLGMKIFRNN